MKNFCSKALLLFLFIGFAACTQNQETGNDDYYLPWEELGELFHDVQMEGIFPDSKTFVDYTPNEHLRQLWRIIRRVKTTKIFP